MFELKLSTVALCCAMGISALAQAQILESQELETVHVRGVKDPDAFDVAKAMAIVQKFEDLSEKDRSQIRISFWVVTKSGAPLPAGTHMALATADGDQALTLLPSGELIVPKLSHEEAKGSEVMTNTRKGTIKINYLVQPIFTTQMTLGYLRTTLVQMRGAYKQLYGALLGWSVPVFTCAKAMYTKPSVISIRTNASDAKVVWTSEHSTQPTIPVNDGNLVDDFILDWGLQTPYRLGGCVDEKK